MSRSGRAISVSLVSLIERGHLDRVSLHGPRRVAAILDIRIGVIASWRGGELERLLSARHSLMQGAVARSLGELGGWTVVPEVSFSIWGERGSIDLLCWHAASQALLVIEVKTEILDPGQLVSVLDRKRRLAPEIVRERGWIPRRVASWVVVAEGATNRRRVAQHAALLRTAYPDDGRGLRRWLRNPASAPGAPFAGLTFFSDSTPGRSRAGMAPIRRVRRPGAPAG